MHAAKVEKSHVKIHGGAQVFERLAESETQPREAPQMRPHAQVRSFDMASADVFEFRIAADWDRDNGLYVSGVVPFRPFRIGFPVEFQELREVNVRAESFLDSGNVPTQAVRRDLKSSDYPLAQVADKFVRARRNALPDVVGQDHFRFGINRHPHVTVAPLFRRVAVKVPFLRVNESPKLIRLNVVRADIPNLIVEKIPALLSDCKEQRENRALMRSRYAGYGANAHSFQQERDDLAGLLSRDVAPSKRLVARFRERSLASRAAIPLDSMASVESEPLCFVVLAFEAGHVGFSLVFSSEKPNNEVCRFRCGLRPRLNLAPSLAQTRGGVFSSSHSTPVQSTHGVRVKNVERLPVGSFAFNKPASALAESCKSCVEESQRIGICADVHSSIRKRVHHVGCCHSDCRKRLKNLSAEFRKSGSRCDTVITGKPFEHRKICFQLRDFTGYQVKLPPEIFKLLFCSQVARFVRVSENIRHERSVQ